jgi:60 kDa SS-A/Ro ribonucleoprotein
VAFEYVKQFVRPGGTPQSEAIPGRERLMSPNAAGGYAFDIDDRTRLDRFLILGTEGGTFYTATRAMTREAAAGVLRCIASDGVATVERIVEVSASGRAPKNDPAVFALALAAKLGDEATRARAYAAVPVVCRTGTHLFQFASAVDGLGGWGRGARKAVGRWYTSKEPDELAYQLVKYRQREGWAHADLLRLAHPKPGEGTAGLLAFAAGKQNGAGLPRVVEGFLAAQGAAGPEESARLVREYNLPRECVRTEHLGEPEVLEALLERMPLTAMIRNLGNLTRTGVVAPFSDGTGRVVERLSDAGALRKARVHPMAVYLALATYSSGRGARGTGTWTPVQQVVDALDAAFYASMDNVEPTGKRILLAVDVSGSMTWGASGMPVSAAEAAAAMALVVARTEPNHLFLGVDTGPVELRISPKMRLDAVTAEVKRRVGGGTDLSVPARWLEKERIEVDAIVLLTDSETWAGDEHPAEALASYRRKIGLPVRNVVASLTATGYSVGEPQDPLTLQCAGLDASLPEVIRGFVSGEF